MQIFVRGLNACTSVVSVLPEHSVRQLQQHIQASEGLPVAEQVLQCGGRPLHCCPHSSLAELGVTPDATVHLGLRLAGGKGGFGSLLRGAGRAIQSSNTDACRDLSGRRVRHANAEKRLAEWAAEAKQRELEKVAMKHEKELIKATEAEKRAMLDTAFVRKQQEEAIARVEAAVESTMASLEAHHSSADAKRATAGAGGPPAKRARYMGFDDDWSDSDEGTDTELGLGEAEAGSSGSDGGLSAPAATTSAAPAAAQPPAATVGSSAVLPPAPAAAQAASPPPAAEGPPAPAAAADPPPAVHEAPAPAAAAAVPEAASAQEASHAPPEPIDLQQCGNVGELEAMGLDRLKHELARQGLKCGGTLQERAARLWLVKTTPRDAIPTKHLVKAKAASRRD